MIAESRMCNKNTTTDQKYSTEFDITGLRHQLRSWYIYDSRQHLSQICSLLKLLPERVYSIYQIDLKLIKSIPRGSKSLIYQYDYLFIRRHKLNKININNCSERDTILIQNYEGIQVKIPLYLEIKWDLIFNLPSSMYDRGIFNSSKHTC